MKDKIKTINMSLSDMNFKPESFDIIWSEGFIFIIGFEKVLIFWHPFLKENDGLAVSELLWLKLNPPLELKTFQDQYIPYMKSIEDNITFAENAGYHVISSQQGGFDGFFKLLKNKPNLLSRK